MLYLIPTILIACIATFFLGYHYRGVTLKIKELEFVVKSRVDNKPEIKEPKSQLIDPNDEIQSAIYEHERMMKRLNP